MLGSFAVKAGPMMAGFDTFDIVLTGKGGHAAIPHIAADPIVGLGSLIMALQTIASRQIDPTKQAVLSITAVNAGSTYNVIPEAGRIQGTVRYFDPEAQALIAEQTAAAFGLSARISYSRRYPATINSPAEAEQCAQALIAMVGAANFDLNPTLMMASEDFAFMLQAKPGCYVWAGNGEGPNVHNPHYDFNDELLPYAAAYWVNLARTLLPRY